jgi:hypothetical protein
LGIESNSSLPFSVLLNGWRDKALKRPRGTQESDRTTPASAQTEVLAGAVLLGCGGSEHQRLVRFLSQT